MPATPAFLSREEVAELTGYVMPSAQARWLARQGLRHWIARTGRPVVPRSAIDGTATQDNDGGFQLGKVA